MKIDIFVPQWYVLHTKSRFENVVSDALMKKSKEIFLPKILVQSRRVDRKKMIRVPLFSGYVFVKTSLDPREHLDILKTAGAVQLVGSRSGPVPVPGETIASLKIMVSTDNPLNTGPHFEQGDRVMVISGPFAGVRGIFSRYRGVNRVIVNIEVLGQYVAAEVNEDDVEKIPEILT
ncbi:MAG: transcription termination/antitermination protein NusG [Desulfococcaceae bacterium]